MITVEATDPQLPCFQRLMAHLRNNCRLLVDFENSKKEPHHKSSSITGQKLHSKRSFSNTEGQNGGPKPKRSRVENQMPNGNDEAPKPPTSMSGMTLDDRVKSSFKNRNGDKSNPTVPAYPNIFPPMSSFPNQGCQTPYGLPAFALYPAGTHYVPVPLNTGIQIPGNNFGSPILPAPIIAPGLGYPHVPGMSTLPVGGLSNPFSGLVPPYVPMGGIGGITSLKGPEGLPAYLAQDAKTKERSQERPQDSSGSSENDLSGDEYNFSTTSSSNLSDVGIQTDHVIDHSDYFSAGSR